MPHTGILVGVAALVGFAGVLVFVCAAKVHRDFRDIDRELLDICRRDEQLAMRETVVRARQRIRRYPMN